MVPSLGCDRLIYQIQRNGMFSTLSSQPEAHPLQPSGNSCSSILQVRPEVHQPWLAEKGGKRQRKLQRIGERDRASHSGTAGQEEAGPGSGLEEQMDTRGCGH